MANDKLFDWSSQEEKQRFDVSKAVIIVGWSFMMIIGILILAANIYMMINGIPTNETLINWGGIVLGFLFGSFPSLLKEFITDKPNQPKS